MNATQVATRGEFPENQPGPESNWLHDRFYVYLLHFRFHLLLASRIWKTFAYLQLASARLGHFTHWLAAAQRCNLQAASQNQYSYRLDVSNWFPTRSHASGSNPAADCSIISSTCSTAFPYSGLAY